MLAERRTDTVILRAASLLLAAGLACGLASPPLFWMALSGAGAAGVAFLAFRHPTAFCIAWLLLTGMSLEMTLHDLAGEAWYQATIAAVKTAGIGLAAVCALRFGPRLPLLNPVWAYAAMLCVGFAHGLYPGLTAADSVRSLIGSVAPFAFCFCRLPRPWPGAVIRAAQWCPAAAVAACLPLAAAGVRPLFVDSGGMRLAGLGHPAFLAGVCLPAIYACLIQLYRQGRRGNLCLLAANFLILALTGARAPMACAVAVTGTSLLTIRSPAFRPRCRLLLLLAAGCAVPVLALFAADLADVRLFNVVANEAGNLSGRGLLWPAFEAAAGTSPWFGWGIGAGNAVIPPDGLVARTLHTWAAHNEYLRMEVEGGEVGRALLGVLFAAWVMTGTRGLPAAERRIMRLAFLAFACHAATDNVLISTPACVLVAFATAVFARGKEARGAAPNPVKG
jgi:O-antigen ligase